MIPLDRRSASIRGNILKVGSYCGNAAHFGGSLSIVEILVSLYFSVMKYDVKRPQAIDRDRFILSKGHAALALNATLFEANHISKTEFYSFQTNGSKWTAHPVKNPEQGVEASTGSLGQGISFATGVAEGLRRKSRSSRVFCLVGDGECNEGSVFEALRLARQRGLSNLVVIVDRNGFQNDGPTCEIIDNDDLGLIFQAMGLMVSEVDGHNLEHLVDTLNRESESVPHVILANTIKGRGLEMMEGVNDWHHGRLTEKMMSDLKWTL